MNSKSSIELGPSPRLSERELDNSDEQLRFFLASLGENLGFESLPYVRRRQLKARKLANAIQRMYGFRPNIKLHGDHYGEDNPGRIHGFNRELEFAKRRQRRFYQQNRQLD